MQIMISACTCIWSIVLSKKTLNNKNWTILDFKPFKTLGDRKTLPRVHLIGCQGVKLFLLEDPFKVFFNNLRFVII